MRNATAYRHAPGIAFGNPGGTPYRVLIAGTELRMVVLAVDASGCIGVDLDSGAFVRSIHPPMPEVVHAFDVVSGEIEGTVEPPDAARPEAVLLAGPPQPAGALTPRRAERLLAPLHHPPQLPLLGLPGKAVPYWTVAGDRPSLALVDVRNEPRLFWGSYGPECHFSWQGAAHDLALADPMLVAHMEAHGLSRPAHGDVQRLLGFRTRRLLVMLTPPENGYCHKVVAALLPSGR
ncbi:MAG: hypothetical protein LC733_02340 [Actinobacteria bacterium]|nr:hypothetical protein [Actinomycetota bacterium]